MRPLELTVEGLRSFRSAVTLDLRDRDQIAVVGDTGAGKSSIIEAITYALYGQPTFSGLNRELMNDTATTLRVALRFRVAGAEWEAVRTLRRRGSGAVGAQNAQLRGFDAKGELQEMVEQARRVNDRIEALIGLDRDAFLRTTVLPQGRFAQLLVADDPTLRSAILRQVWRTDELEAAGQVAEAAHRDSGQLRARLAQAAAGYPDDPAAHLVQLREQEQQAGSAAATADQTERQAAAAHEALQAAAAERTRVRAAAQRLDTFDSSALAAQLAPLEAAGKELDGLQAAVRESQNEVAHQLTEIPADNDGPAVAQVAAALTTLPGLPRLAGEVTAAADELGARSTGAAESGAAAERDAAAAEHGRAAAQAHDALRPPLEQALQSAQRGRDRLAELHAAAAAAVRAAEAAGAELAQREQTRQEVAAQLQAAGDMAAQRSQAAARAQEHLAAARRSDSAALIASALHPGDQCPICRAALAPDWQAPATGDLDATEQAAEAACAVAAEAHDAQVALAARDDAAGKALRQAEEQARGAREEAAAARSTLAQAAVALDSDGAPPIAADEEIPLPSAESLLAPLEAAVQAAEGALAQHAERRDALAQAAASAEQAAAVAEQAAAAAEQRRSDAEQAAAAALQRLRRALAAIPEPYRPPLQIPDAAQELRAPAEEVVEDRIAAARQREEVLDERAQSRDLLNATLRELTAEQKTLAERRAAEVDAPLAAIVRDLRTQRDRLARSAVELGQEPDVPDLQSASAGPEALAEWIDQLAAGARRLAQHVEDLTARARAEEERAKAALTQLAESLSADAEDYPAIVQQAREAAESARYASRSAQEQAAAFAAKADHVAALRALLGEVEERERALADLAAALKDGAFPKWLTLRRSRSLLVHASRTLQQISNGRFAFVEPAGELDRWQVLDRDSGQPRSPASLSGGEQFIASLALALGMVEMMARSGGRLESLFLDEGFGSLDRSNLDAAIEALGMVAAGGRMVVLISHVQAVAEQVPHVAAVTRTAAGSRVEWLSAAQRDRLGEADAGSSALSGLLD